MPLLEDSDYVSPLFFSNGHLQSIYPTLFRKVTGIGYRRERIETSDADFLDLDWSEVTSDTLVIISHGLEGNSTRSYVLGMVRCMNRYGWDALAWNFRGCSGEMNRKPQFYHSGATYDLHDVVKHVSSLNRYKQIYLIGFSMGGNITLKYLSDYVSDIPEEVKAAATFSVPCDLADSAIKITDSAGGIYMKRFMNLLKHKVRQKAKAYPGSLSLEGLDQMNSFYEFDNAYTAPLHGFKDADDYWQKSSCKKYLTSISRPALLVNALNDPFLTESCFPIEEAVRQPLLFLETPKYGGHVGFMRFHDSGTYWSEQRAVRFLKEFK